MLKPMREQGFVVKGIWLILLLAFVGGIAIGRLSLSFIAGITFLLTLVPVYFAQRMEVKLPLSFIAAIVVFIFATIFLGEAIDFYEKYWWWDIVLHGGSALGFGLIGFLFVFTLFEGDRYAAPPVVVAFMALNFAVTIGVLWEIFEFAMDQWFGLNMQKSGLVDTMGDLIVDVAGASLGAGAGYLYLSGRDVGGVHYFVDGFIKLNRRLFRKHRLGRGGRGGDARARTGGQSQDDR